MHKEPFVISVPDAILTDLRERLAGTFRSYYERRVHPWLLVHQRQPVVEAPTGVVVFLEDVTLMPRRWAERYYNLQRWTLMPQGGHFAPMEEPERLVDDVWAFFRSLREREQHHKETRLGGGS